MSKVVKLTDEAHAALMDFVGWRKYCREENGMMHVASRAILEFIKKKQDGE